MVWDFYGFLNEFLMPDECMEMHYASEKEAGNGKAKHLLAYNTLDNKELIC